MIKQFLKPTFFWCSSHSFFFLHLGCSLRVKFIVMFLFSLPYTTQHVPLPSFLILLFLHLLYCIFPTILYAIINAFILLNGSTTSHIPSFIHSTNLYRLSITNYIKLHSHHHFPSLSLHQFLFLIYIFCNTSIVIGAHHNTLPMTALSLFPPITCGFMIYTKLSSSKISIPPSFPSFTPPLLLVQQTMKNYVIRVLGNLHKPQMPTYSTFPVIKSSASILVLGATKVIIRMIHQF